jgi:hypothetical protein
MAGAAVAAQSLDVVFVIDTSGSINNNERALEIGGVKEAIEDVLLPAATFMEIRVGAVCFSNYGAKLLDLTLLSPASLPMIHAGIDRAEDPGICSHTGNTNIGNALEVAIDLLATGSATRSVINFVSNGGLTTGPDPVPIADAFKKGAGHEIWTLGVAVNSAGKDLLEKLAGPAPAGYFPASSFDDFKRAETEKLGDIVDGDVVDSFVVLLEGQLTLLESFGTLLIETWPDLSPEDRVKLAISFEDLLKRMVKLLISFEDILKGKWRSLAPAQRAHYLTVFEEMLRRLSELLDTFEYLVKSLEGIALRPLLDPQGLAVPIPCTDEMLQKGLCGAEEPPDAEP